MMAAIKPLIGIVRIQAQRRLTVTPHRTADNRFVAPTPIIEPVMVWVVLTGILKCSVRKRVIAPAVSAATPSNGVTFVIRVPIVFTIFHPPLIVPNPIATKQLNGTQSGMEARLGMYRLDTIATPIRPITFCASLPPCPMLKAAEESSCNRLNHLSALYGLDLLKS